jgi:hypothetical protein
MIVQPQAVSQMPVIPQTNEVSNGEHIENDPDPLEPDFVARRMS